MGRLNQHNVQRTLLALQPFHCQWTRNRLCHASNWGLLREGQNKGNSRKRTGAEQAGMSEEEQVVHRFLHVAQQIAGVGCPSVSWNQAVSRC